MTEPVSSGAATAGAAALVSYVIAVIGVHPQAVVVALCGTVAGVLLAPKYPNKALSVIVFFAVAVLCAHAGNAASLYFFNGSEAWRNFLAGFGGFFFHPLTSWALKVGPKALTKLITRRDEAPGDEAP